ncbi:MAG: heme exporter protein CcmB [Alphaproteobacteria bacterium]|nr:heme exporter protein CcmB [Alphaproteobacteria bacterium]
MSAFAALLARDIRLAARAGGSAMLALGFFAAVVTLLPLGIGSEARLLASIAAGVLWIAAVLANLLTLDRLFQADYEDGSLDLFALSPLSLEGIAGAKIMAHWLTTGLPLTILSPLLAVLLHLPAAAYPALLVSLLTGTPAISAIGAVATALTVTVRRGGLLLPLIVLPLLTPVVIFGAGTVLASIDGLQNGGIWFLAAFAGVTLPLSPFVAAAALRLNLSE